MRHFLIYLEFSCFEYKCYFSYFFSSEMNLVLISIIWTSQKNRGKSTAILGTLLHILKILKCPEKVSVR